MAVTSSAEGTTLNAGSSITLTASDMYPQHSGAQNISRTYQWFVEPFYVGGREQGQTNVVRASGGGSQQAVLTGVSPGWVVVTCKKSISYKYRDSRIGMRSAYNEDIDSWVIEITRKLPQSISLNPSSLHIKTTDKNYRVTATVLPAEAEQTVNYSSSDNSVVSVDSNGYLTPHKAGNAVITASTANGLTDTCKVSVYMLKIKSLKLNKTKCKIKRTGTVLLTCTPLPQGADGTLTWKSSNPKVADVNTFGMVTAKKVGKADIVVKSSNGKKAVCKVTVFQPELKSIKLNKKSINLVEGDKTSIKYTLNPKGAIGKVKWKSSNSKVVTVDSKGIIRAKKGGTAKVTAYVTSKIKADCKITVKSKATSIKLNKSSITLSCGNSYKLTYTLYPKNSVGSVTWSSSNPNVANVDSEGNVTAKGGGTAVITAKVSSKVKQTCKVTVPVPAESIELSADS